jgi:hypothetical protein
VTADFGNMLQRLPRAVFDITFIYFAESGSPPDAMMMEKEDDHIIINGKMAGGPDVWVPKVKAPHYHG